MGKISKKQIWWRRHHRRLRCEGNQSNERRLNHRPYMFSSNWILASSCVLPHTVTLVFFSTLSIRWQVCAGVFMEGAIFVYLFPWSAPSYVCNPGSSSQTHHADAPHGNKKQKTRRDREEPRELCVCVSLFIMRKTELAVRRTPKSCVLVFHFPINCFMLPNWVVQRWKAGGLFYFLFYSEVGGGGEGEKNVHMGYDHCLSLMTLMMSGFRFPSTVKTYRKKKE